MFREHSIGDYGIDAIIEMKEDKHLSGKLIAIQIKTGDSYFSAKKIIVRYIKNYYWLNRSLPVIIALYSPTTGELIGEYVKK